MYLAVPGVSQELEVFPLKGESFHVALPFPLAVFAYGPDGKALYGFDGRRRQARMAGVFEFELTPIRALKLSGSDAIGRAGLAVSPDQKKLILSGGGLGISCAIFEFDTATGDTRKIVSNSQCDPLDPLSYWTDLSLSPDGTRLVALRNRRLELITVRDGEITIPRNASYSGGAWSPDGRWLAVTSADDSRTRLLDSSTLEEAKVLGKTDLTWSPDSRYLLATKRQVLCGLGETYTLETVDVETSKRTEIESSRCLVHTRTIGWVSKEIVAR
jgi:WD40 repeat protein